MSAEPDDRATLVADLAAALAPDRVRTGGVELSLYGRDASVLAGEAAVACFPLSTGEVAAAVRIARRHGRPFVARGSGTGLAGGAVPVGDPVVIVTTKMDRIVSIDPDERVAWVEPGVINLDLTRELAPYGLHFAPDPSSQQACTIGGNVANNSGGPHCLAYGVTSAHVLAMEVVLPDGSVTVLGGLDPEPPGLDLRGAFVGSEGTLGIATRIAVRLTPNPPAVATLLLDFPTVDAARRDGQRHHRRRHPARRARDDGPPHHAPRPRSSPTPATRPTPPPSCWSRSTGCRPGSPMPWPRIGDIGRAHGARAVRVAADDAERALLWKGRKSAFGAVARVAPNYYLHDTVVPRTRLVEVLTEVYAIAARHDLDVMNVFHAGDGNLHPLLLFDAREPGVMERVHAAGDEIVRVSLAAGGVLSGEHGIGLEKRDLMPLLFGPDDLDAQARLREAFDPDGVANPTKVLPGREQVRRPAVGPRRGVGVRCAGAIARPDRAEAT